MPRRALVLLLIVAVLATLGWLLGRYLAAERVVNTPTKNGQSAVLTAIDEAEEKPPSPSVSQAGSIDGITSNPYEQAAIKGQIMQVADLYAEAAKYPHYSQPILNPEDFLEPEPFEETEVDTPFPKKDQQGEALRVQLATDRFQYFSGETILARLRVVNVDPNSFISAKGVIAGQQGDTNLIAEFQATENPREFSASFDTRLASKQSLSDEMLLKVSLQIDDEPIFTTVGFRYQQADAQLVALPWARPEGAFLNIALQYDVFKTGYYFSNAVLADAATDRPLIQLQAEGQMQAGSAILVMRAHGSALAATGSEGPYVLRSVRSYRGAEQGETFDTPAASLLQRYDLPGYRFDQYSGEEFVDPLAQERAQFLNELGSIEEEEDQ